MRIAEQHRSTESRLRQHEDSSDNNNLAFSVTLQPAANNVTIDPYKKRQQGARTQSTTPMPQAEHAKHHSRQPDKTPTINSRTGTPGRHSNCRQHREATGERRTMEPNSARAYHPTTDIAEKTTGTCQLNLQDIIQGVMRHQDCDNDHGASGQEQTHQQ
jgi:hypothetical protein